RDFDVPQVLGLYRSVLDGKLVLLARAVISYCQGVLAHHRLLRLIPRPPRRIGPLTILMSFPWKQNKKMRHPAQGQTLCARMDVKPGMTDLAHYGQAAFRQGEAAFLSEAAFLDTSSICLVF